MSVASQVRPTARTAAQAASTPSPRPVAAPQRPPLRVVPPDRAKRRARQRRGRALIVAIGLFVALGMFAIVGAQVVLTQRQLRLDTMGQELSQVQTQDDALQLQVANLESPSRIVSEAETQLHMLLPTSVVYLTPGAEPETPKVEGVPAGGAQTGSAGATTTPTTGTGAPG